VRVWVGGLGGRGRGRGSWFNEGEWGRRTGGVEALWGGWAGCEVRAVTAFR